MITNNAGKKTRCQLDGKNIVIDGELYPISSINETRSYKGRMIFVYILMTIFTLYVAFLSPIVTLVLVPVWLVLLRMHSKEYFNARSFWFINGKWVYVEQNDAIGLEQQLKEISLDYSHRAGNETHSQVSIKRKDKIEGLLWLITIIFFIMILILTVRGYISEMIGIPLFVIAVIAIMALRFYDLKEGYIKLKWKK